MNRSLLALIIRQRYIASTKHEIKCTHINKAYDTALIKRSKLVFLGQEDPIGFVWHARKHLRARDSLTILFYYSNRQTTTVLRPQRSICTSIISTHGAVVQLNTTQILLIPAITFSGILVRQSY